MVSPPIHQSQSWIGGIIFVVNILLSGCTTLGVEYSTVASTANRVADYSNSTACNPLTMCAASATTRKTLILLLVVLYHSKTLTR